MTKISKRDEDKTTISAMHRLGEAISYACGGRYEAAVYCLEDAKKELETLRDNCEAKVLQDKEAKRAVSA